MQTVEPRPTHSMTLELGLGTVGVAAFGDPPSVAIEQLSRVLGSPDQDTGWVDSFSRFGTCPGERIRAVTWQQFRVMFTDGRTDYGASGARHLFAWDYGYQETGRLSLSTPEGVGIGSTVRDVREAYPSAELHLDDEVFGPNFTLRGETEAGLLSGFFTAPTDDATVTGLSYGAPQCSE